MTVSLTTFRCSYTATAGQTVFPYTFMVLAASDLKAYVNGIEKVRDIDYSVSGVGTAVGGNVTFAVGLSEGDAVVLRRETPRQQLTALASGGRFYEGDLEQMVDKLTLIAQEFPGAMIPFSPPGYYLRTKDGSGVEAVASMALGTAMPFDIGPSAPLDGTFSAPFFRFNSDLGAGGELGWGCLTGGSPGLWEGFSRFVGPWVDIRRHGGVGDDITDCTAAVEAAIAALPSGGTIYFPRGIYRISNIVGLIANTKGINFIGDGEYATHFRVFSTTGNVFDMTGARFVTFTGFGFTPTSTPRTDGYLFYMSASADHYFSRLRIGCMYNGFYFGSSSGATVVEDVKGTDYGSHTWNRFFYVDGVNSSIRVKRVGLATSNEATDAAFTLAYNAGAVDTFIAENIYAQKFGSGLIPYGLRILGGDFVHVTTSHFECGSASALGISVEGGNDIHLNDCHASTNLNGLVMSGGDGVYVNGGRYYYNAREGIKVTGGAHFSAFAPDINDNSTETTGTYDGFYVAAGVSEWKLVAATIGKVRGDAPAATHRYGVFVADGASDKYTITGNIITDFGTGAIYDGGTGARRSVVNNPGSSHPDRLSTDFTGNTVDGATADLWTFSLADETCYYIEARVLAQGSGGLGHAAYTRHVIVYRDAGGAATIEGAVNNTVDIEWHADADATFVVSGDDVILRVTGVAGIALRWRANIQYIDRVSGGSD